MLLFLYASRSRKVPGTAAETTPTVLLALLLVNLFLIYDSGSLIGPRPISHQRAVGEDEAKVRVSSTTFKEKLLTHRVLSHVMAVLFPLLRSERAAGGPVSFPTHSRSVKRVKWWHTVELCEEKLVLFFQNSVAGTLPESRSKIQVKDCVLISVSLLRKKPSEKKKS